MTVIQRLIFSAIVLTFGVGSQALAQAARTTDTLSLSTAIAMSIEHSPLVTEATARVDAATSRVGLAESMTNPQVSLYASYTRVDPTVTVTLPLNGTPTSFQMAPNNIYDGGIRIEQSVLDFGNASAQRAAAQAATLGASDRVGLAKESTAFQTIQQYYAILTIDQNVKIETEQLGILQQTLDIAKTRLQAGSATTLDPLNIQVRISKIRNELTMLGAGRSKHVAVLRQLTGLPTDHRIVVTDVTSRRPTSVVLDSLVQIATANRVEIVAAKHDEAAAKLAIAAADASNNPHLGLTITGGVKDGYLPSLEQPKLNWAGGIGLQVPLLDGGRTQSKDDEAEANYRVAVAHTVDVERSVRSEVEQALAELNAVDEQRELIQTQLDQARQALQITQLSYKNGAATNLDVLTAQSNLEQSELERAQLGYQYALSEYALERAIGTPLY